MLSMTMNEREKELVALLAEQCKSMAMSKNC